MARALAVGALVLALLAPNARAQFSKAPGQLSPTTAQDSTLAGIKAVFLSANDSATARAFSLELRKAGVRIVPNGVGEPADAEILVVANQIGRAISTDAMLTIVVNQRVQVMRGARIVQIPTWISQTAGRNVVWDTWYPKARQELIDDFLNRWLAANGR